MDSKLSVKIVPSIKLSAMVKFTDAYTYIVVIFIQQEGVDSEEHLDYWQDQFNSLFRNGKQQM
jgi:hypothetical protein